MTRGGSVILGVGLLILWIAGLSSPVAQPWMTWLDGVAGVIAFLIAGGMHDRVSRSARVGGPIALSIGLFVMWIVGLSTRVPSWQNWWTFAFACAFFLLGIAGGTARTAVTPASLETRESTQDRFRRSA